MSGPSFRVGERVTLPRYPSPWPEGWHAHLGAHGTVTEQVTLTSYLVLVDGTDTTVGVSVGLLDRETTTTQRLLARANLERAGWTLRHDPRGAGYRTWAWYSPTGSQSCGVGDPTEDNPEQITANLVNTWGHENMPVCAECGLTHEHGGRYCSTCGFWLEKLEWTERGRSLRTRSGDRIVHYSCEPGIVPARPGMGHGGDRFTFRLADASTVVSNDVWFQGEIPARFHDRLPVNATIEPETVP